MRTKRKTYLNGIVKFISNFVNLFDIAYQIRCLIKINEDRIFLQRQKESGRPGQLVGVDKNRSLGKLARYAAAPDQVSALLGPSMVV